MKLHIPVPSEAQTGSPLPIAVPTYSVTPITVDQFASPLKITQFCVTIEGIVYACAGDSPQAFQREAVQSDP